MESADKAGTVKQWAFLYQPQENKAVALLRSLLRILFIIIHEFNETAITLRASALTYTIVLSMVPMLAMSTALLKGLGSDNQLRLAAYKFIDQLEPDGQPPLPGIEAEADPLLPELDSSEPEGETTPVPEESALLPNTLENNPVPESSGSDSLTEHLRSAVDTIFDYVDKTNFAALGAFGIAGLLLTVVLVLSTIEGAMNAIWHTKQGRSIFRKIMDYLALLILLPISINVALAGDAIIESPAIMAHLDNVFFSEWAVRMLLKLLPFLFVILSLMVMYLFFPNVKVKTYAAFLGAIFAGVFWFLVQKAYILLQIGVSKYNAIYGSFATVPLFLVWVHLGWTFILLGASLAYAVQNRNLYHLPGTNVSPQKNLQLAFDIINTIYSYFNVKKQTSFDDLVQENPTGLPGDIQDITQKLLKGGLIRQVDDDNRSYVPASPSESIEASEVVRLILGSESVPTMGGEYSQKVLMAAEQAIPPDAFPQIEAEHIPVNKISEEQDEPHAEDEKAP